MATLVECQQRRQDRALHLQQQSSSCKLFETGLRGRVNFPDQMHDGQKSYAQTIFETGLKGRIDEFEGAYARRILSCPAWSCYYRSPGIVLYSHYNLSINHLPLSDWGFPRKNKGPFAARRSARHSLTHNSRGQPSSAKLEIVVE